MSQRKPQSRQTRIDDDGVIVSSILSAGEFPDAFSRALSIAMHHKETAFIMVVTNAIFPKNMTVQLPNKNKRKKYCPMQQLMLINKKKIEN